MKNEISFSFRQKFGRFFAEILKCKRCKSLFILQSLKNAVKCDFARYRSYPYSRERALQNLGVIIFITPILCEYMRLRCDELCSSPDELSEARLRLYGQLRQRAKSHFTAFFKLYKITRHLHRLHFKFFRFSHIFVINFLQIFFKVLLKFH